MILFYFRNILMDKIYGCFFGGITGDALGAPVEFKSRDSFKKVTDMNLYNYNFDLPIGSWTDDTSMTLCLAHSLIKYLNVNKYDNLQRYKNWLNNGYMSVNGVCFDIGTTTICSINDFEINKNTIAIPNFKMSGNGALMRLSPVVLFYVNNSVELCMEKCVESAITTHSSDICKDTARLLGCILHCILNNTLKENLVTKWQSIIDKNTICNELLSIYNGDFLQKTRLDIFSTGYAIHSLEASLFSFFKHDNYKDSVLFSVNLGNDTDTIACITGKICGAYYGIHDIPVEWLNKLAKKELLWNTINNLYSMSS
jgi:ADP-ribosyl-[dinitrogen reductase] hydrolase